MNYRHAFHAGNFADVFKHALLARILVALAAKPRPSFYLDTHAGIGLYDLAAEASSRTLEWRSGLGRACAALEGASAEVGALLKPWRDAVGPLDSEGRPLYPYPGSPALAARLLRPEDRIVACELNPEDAMALERALGADPRVQIRAEDGYRALNALVPPPERRGLVLVDPPFEATDEFAAMERAVLRAFRKWPTGVFLVWFPLKDRPAAEAFARALLVAGPKRMVRATLDVGTGDVRGLDHDDFEWNQSKIMKVIDFNNLERDYREKPASTFSHPAPGAAPGRGPGLRATGLIALNPPWTFADEARTILPFLARAMGEPGSWTCEVLADS